MPFDVQHEAKVIATYWRPDADDHKDMIKDLKRFAKAYHIFKHIKELAKLTNKIGRLERELLHYKQREKMAEASEAAVHAITRKWFFTCMAKPDASARKLSLELLVFLETEGWELKKRSTPRLERS